MKRYKILNKHNSKKIQIINYCLNFNKKGDFTIPLKRF